MRRAAFVVTVCGAMLGAGLYIDSMDSLDLNDPVSTTVNDEVAGPDVQRRETTPVEQEAKQGEANTSPVLASRSVAQWTSEATGDDAAKRAAAINALGTAPKSLAVPVLQKILSAGADGDRQLALNSLRTLALDHGDADGVIRDTLRLAVYDGDDAVAAEMQAALEEIEYHLDEVASNRN